LDWLSLISASWKILFKVMVSFLVGALIGLEREKSRIAKLEQDLKDPEKLAIYPGVRSFSFLGLIGALTILVPSLISYQQLALWICTSLIIMAVLLIILYTSYRMFILKEGGITTSIALGIAYLLGFMAGAGLILEAISISVLVTFILALKFKIQHVIRGISYTELLSALEIGIIIFLIGPLIPEEIYDPLLHIINLRLLYVFFIIMLLLSYMSYITIKLRGIKALSYFSFLGGLINSEATTVSLLRLYLKERDIRDLIVGSIILSNVAMLIRNLIFISFLSMIQHLELATMQSFIVPLVSSVSIGLAFSRERIRHRSTCYIRLSEKLRSPLSLRLSIKILISFGIVLLLMLASFKLLGLVGILFSSVIGGIAGTEAVILTSFTLLSSGKISSNLLTLSSLCAIVTGILNKLILALSVSTDRYLLRGLSWRLVIIAMPCILTILHLLIV